ncbi:MAG TPA: Type 1 glutamine amidotransferase-like domain-containing protein [Actinospica sp.]|nr:Type 1 glutamine amidotransferase-like domain-containing protein [Actinospica sp.]
MTLRLLLTSSGLRNETQREALNDLLGQPTEESNIVYLPTASVAERGDHGWFVADLNRVHGLGWGEFDILELNGLPRELVLERLRHADVIYAEGGNHYHLARSLTENGLAEDFRELLESRVYVGVSAGSMIFSSRLDERSADVIGDVADLHLLGATTIRPPLGLFDWYLKPHLYSPDFPERDDAWAEAIAAAADFPIYFIDDQTAIRVDGAEIEVVSEGTWRHFPGPGPVSAPVTLPES